jgi:hypothetical protein
MLSAPELALLAARSAAVAVNGRANTAATAIAISLFMFVSFHDVD